MYRFEKNDFFRKHQFVISDLICMQLIFLIPYFLGKWERSDIGFQIIISLVDICVLFFLESFKNIYSRGYLKEAKSVIVGQSAVFAIMLALLFLEGTSGDYSKDIMAYMYAASLILVYIERIIVKKISVKYFKGRKHERSVMVIAPVNDAEEIISTIKENKYSDFTVVAIGLIGEGGENKIGKEILGVPVVAADGEIPGYIKENIVDEVLINHPTGENALGKIVAACEEMGVVLHYMLNTAEESYERKIVEDFGGYRVLTCGANIVSARQLFFKRAMDIAGSLVGLVITGLLFIVVAPAIYIKSPGPVFFSQERIGLNGRRFKVYKFRSMYMDAEERKAALAEQNKMDGLMFKMDDDPRIIKGVGNFIRKTSIDEFPQMWNVFKGDMSLVGTRPPTVDEFEKYNYHHKSRLATKPGITGMWQVSGRSNITDFEEVVALDNKYIYNWSLGLDCRILLKTVLVVFKNEGSV